MSTSCFVFQKNAYPCFPNVPPPPAIYEKVILSFDKKEDGGDGGEYVCPHALSLCVAGRRRGGRRGGLRVNFDFAVCFFFLLSSWCVSFKRAATSLSPKEALPSVVVVSSTQDKNCNNPHRSTVVFAQPLCVFFVPRLHRTSQLFFSFMFTHDKSPMGHVQSAAAPRLRHLRNHALPSSSLSPG